MTYQPETVDQTETQPLVDQAAAYQPEPVVAEPKPTTLAYTNTYALLAIIFGFLVPIAGIVFGHLSLGQIKRNGDAGRGLALTGLVLGYVSVAIVLIAVIAYIAIMAIAIATFGFAASEFDSFDSFETY